MNFNAFEEVYKIWENRKPNERIWTDELAEKYGFSSSEGLRSAFRRFRRGLSPDEESKNLNRNSNVGNAKIGIFDLEVSPMVCYAFDLWDQNIGISQIVSDSFLLSWSAKYLNEPKVYSDVLTGDEALNGDDKRIVSSILKFVNSCDILIGHNIQNFDLKKLNIRILKNDLLPVKKSQIIDTLLIARKAFSFPSNSLKYVNKFLGIKQKIENEGFDLWANCMNGDEVALKTMDNYCKGDVLSTEDLYFKIRPFISGHPNLGLFFDTLDERCPNCGSTNLKNEGYYYTPSGKWKSLRCECGAISRSKQNELPTQKRKLLKVN